MDIDTMPAGREMDAEFAEKVMGWHKLGEKQQSMCQPKYWEKLKEMFWVMLPPGSDIWEAVPYYSTEIADAWCVWLKLLEIDPSAIIGKGYVGLHQDHMGPTDIVQADTPLAICRAALKVQGIVNGKGKSE